MCDLSRARIVKTRERVNLLKFDCQAKHKHEFNLDDITASFAGNVQYGPSTGNAYVYIVATRGGNRNTGA
jgi:hypothetical protein